MDPMGMCGIGIMVMVLCIALAYMLAAIFKSPEWEAFAKIELYQVLVSVVGILLIINMTAVVFNSASEWAGAAPGNDVFDVVEEYLNMITFQHAIPALRNLQGLAILCDYLSGMMSKIGPATAFGVSYPIFPGTKTLEAVLEFATAIVGPFISSLLVQQIGLQIIRGTAFTLVLPVGLFLRIFPPTREAGSFLIAISIALFVVLPVTYVMHKNVMEKIMQEDQANPNGNWFDKWDQVAGVSGATNLVHLVGGRFFTPAEIFHPFQELAYMMVQAVFLPALSMIIVTTFVTSMTKFISQNFG